MTASSEVSGARTILVYTHALVGGGAERVCALLATGFARRGYRVVFAVDFEASENRQLLDSSIPVHVLGRGHSTATLALARLLKRERPVASLSALSASNVKHALAAALVGRARRAILSYHGFAQSEPQRLSGIGYKALPALSRMTGRTVAVSYALRDDLASRWRAALGRIVVIHNPIAARTTMLPTASELAARPPLLLAVGRLNPDKDFPRLIRAFAKGAPPEARLVIVGEGPERRALEAQVTREGLEGRVSLPGYVPDPWEHFASARGFVLSSRVESFGLVVAEALARGLPVVATDCGGPREILQGLDGLLGRLVPPEDDESLAEGIKAMLADPGDPRPRAARAEAFSIDAALDAYEALIRSVEAEADPPPPRKSNPPKASAQRA